ncbi:hypothetical protein SLS58_010957 [Diplodia intermedia]|uniref:Uncharacterized protein n=1 Tax=Diplodia intermedia TaxID=856260 RepID=A0ABR3T3N6_9PEZI
MRWDSSQTVAATPRRQIEAVAKKSFQKWIDGWAVRDKALLEDASGVDVYTTTDADAIPQCDEGCGRSAPHVSHKDPEPKDPAAKRREKLIARVIFWQDRSAQGKKSKGHTVHVDENGNWTGKWQKAWKEKKKSRKEMEIAASKEEKKA